MWVEQAAAETRVPQAVHPHAARRFAPLQAHLHQRRPELHARRHRAGAGLNQRQVHGEQLPLPRDDQLSRLGLKGEAGRGVAFSKEERRCGCQRGVAAERDLDGGREPAEREPRGGGKGIARALEEGGLTQVVLGGDLAGAEPGAAEQGRRSDCTVLHVTAQAWCQEMVGTHIETARARAPARTCWRTPSSSGSTACGSRTTAAGFPPNALSVKASICRRREWRRGSVVLELRPLARVGGNGRQRHGGGEARHAPRFCTSPDRTEGQVCRSSCLVELAAGPLAGRQSSCCRAGWGRLRGD